MSHILLVNGVAEDTVNALDRGFQFGDGLFETMMVADGSPRYWPRHWQRLTQGCARLRITPPEQDLLMQEATQLCHQYERGVLKLMISRGVSHRGYAIPNPAKTTRIMMITTMPDYPPTHVTSGVRVKICRTRLGENPALAGIKHLNRLEQVLARMEWDDSTIAEGLMLDNHGYVIEGTMSNVFMVQDQRLFTPALSRCGVAGITRQRILETAQTMGLQAGVEDISLERLMNADEVFLCNSLIGIWPVTQLEARSFSTGPITRTLSKALEQADA